MPRNLLCATVAVAAITLASASFAAPGQGGGASANAGAAVSVPQVSIPSAGPSSAGTDARINSQGSVNAGARAMERASPNAGLSTGSTTTTTSPSQGSQHASPTGVTNSNGGRSSVSTSVTAGSHGTHISPTDMTDSASGDSVDSTDATTSGSQGLQNASPTGIAHANSNSALARGSVSATSLPGLSTGLTVKNSTGVTLGTVSRVVTDTNGSIRLIMVTSSTGKTIRVAPTTATVSGGIVTTTSG